MAEQPIEFNVIGCPANRNFRQKSNNELANKLRVAHLFK
jgi:hypothetical protein